MNIERIGNISYAISKVALAGYLIWFSVERLVLPGLLRLSELLQLIVTLEMPHKFYGLVVLTWIVFYVASIFINWSIRLLDFRIQLRSKKNEKKTTRKD